MIMISNLLSSVALVLMSSVFALGGIRANEQSQNAMTTSYPTANESTSWLNENMVVYEFPLQTQSNDFIKSFEDNYFVAYDGTIHNLTRLNSVVITERYSVDYIRTQVRNQVDALGYNYDDTFPCLFGQIGYLAYMPMGGRTIYTYIVHWFGNWLPCYYSQNRTLGRFDGLEFQLMTYYEDNLDGWVEYRGFDLQVSDYTEYVSVENTYNYGLTYGNLQTNASLVYELSSSNFNTMFIADEFNIGTSQSVREDEEDLLDFVRGYEYNMRLLVAYGDNVSFNNGFNTGWQSGYNQGLNDGVSISQNASFNSLFNSIADTPLRFLYGLFNFDLFGVSMLVIVLTLLTGVIVFGIVKKFWK